MNCSYVCDSGSNIVQILNSELEYMNNFSCCGNGGQDKVGNLYVTITMCTFLTARDSFYQLSVRRVLLPNN